jgi:hypothetical protein
MGWSEGSYTDYLEVEIFTHEINHPRSSEAGTDPRTELKEGKVHNMFEVG